MWNTASTAWSQERRRAGPGDMQSLRGKQQGRFRHTQSWCQHVTIPGVGLPDNGRLGVGRGAKRALVHTYPNRCQTATVTGFGTPGRPVV